MFSKRRAYLCMRFGALVMRVVRAGRLASCRACGTSHVVLGYMCSLSSAAPARVSGRLAARRSLRTSCTQPATALQHQGGLLSKLLCTLRPDAES